MDLKLETLIILFDIHQMVGNFHPLTCGGGGGSCPGVNLKARKVTDKIEIEAYCPNCNKHTQTLYEESNINFLTNVGADNTFDNTFGYLYDKLLMLQRDGKIENILNK